MMGDAEEIDVEDNEQIVGRVAAIDVAKASGKVCTRVPHPSDPARRLTRGLGRCRHHQLDHRAGRAAGRRGHRAGRRGVHL